MKKDLAAFLILYLFSATAFADDSSDDVYVNGYMRNDGRYVDSYHRSSPDNNPYNNYEFINQQSATIYGEAKQDTVARENDDPNGRIMPNPPGLNYGQDRNDKPAPLISRY
jgi:hypothetical protein